MNNQNYQKALYKSWEAYATCFEIIGEEPNEAFKWVFKQAYALGKKIGNSDFSDAEGEEMLIVPRKNVQELYAKAKDIYNLYTNATCINSMESSAIDISTGKMKILDTLFGSKCLPDSSEVKRTLSENLSEQKLVEPKEEIRKSRISPEAGGSWHASMIGSGAATAVLNDSSDDRRLTIAAMAMQGILSNPTAVNGPKLIDGDEKILAEWSLRFADALIAEALIAEAKKGGKNE